MMTMVLNHIIVNVSSKKNSLTQILRMICKKYIVMQPVVKLESGKWIPTLEL